MNRLLYIFATSTGLCLSSLACVSADCLNREVGQQAYEHQEELKRQRGITQRLLSERSRLQSQLGIKQSREREIESGGVTPAEQAELAKVRQEIQDMKRALKDLAAAG